MTKAEYERLYVDLHRAVFKIICQSVRCDRNLMEELSQQVWVKVWRFREGHNPDMGTIKSWVYSITRETIAGHFRREKIRKTQATDWQEIDLVDDQTDRTHSLNEEYDRLAKLREVLPTELHPILENWLAGKSDIEIGQAVGIPAGSVAWHKGKVREIASRIA